MLRHYNHAKRVYPSAHLAAAQRRRVAQRLGIKDLQGRGHA
jgi:hypothetical protein